MEVERYAGLCRSDGSFLVWIDRVAVFAEVLELERDEIPKFAQCTGLFVETRGSSLREYYQSEVVIE